MGHIRYKTKNVDNEFRFLDSLSNIEWGKFKKQTFSTNRGLNLFVEIDGDKWKASVEKFPNRRGKDASGRNIFSVVEAEGILGDDEAQKIFKLISFILLKDNTMEQCGEILDKKFDEKFVNKAFEEDKTEEIAKKLNEFFDEIPETTFPKNSALKYQFAEVVEFTDESVRKLLNGVSRIAEKHSGINHHCIFAVNDLPYSANDLEIIADEIEDIDKIVILTQASSRISVPISDIKKKATTKSSLVLTESRPKSSNGSTKALRIVVPFLIISLIANLVMLTRGNYFTNSTHIMELDSAISSKDSLIIYQNCLIKNKDSLISATKIELDSLKSMTNFIDNINGNIVKLDIAEFSKSGACKLSVLRIDTTKQILFDTVTINSSVDFDKQKKCYVKLYRNSETRPFDEKHHPPFDIRSFCKTANKAKKPSRK